MRKVLFIVMLFVCSVNVLGETKDSVQNENDSLEFVDLGLLTHVLWATKNVGAQNIWDGGLYFAWGEIFPKNEFFWENYKVGTSPETLPEKYDVINVKYGGKCRVPSKEEWQDLVNNCLWVWTTVNGFWGYKIIGPNNNAIFLPAAGSMCENKQDYYGVYGLYWSRSLGEDSRTAYSVGFGKSGYGAHYKTYRYCGMCIRAVKEQ